MGHDIFVSYAHGDNDQPAAADAGWVTTFVEELEKVLRRKLGRKPDVWMDKLLTSNEAVTATLLKRVNDAGTIVLFMSRGYLASRWCRLEIENFLSLNPPARRESVFVVAMDDTARESWPERVQELTPVDMYTVSKGDVTQLLGFPTPPADSSSPYWSRLNDLAHYIFRHLNASPPQASTATTTVPQISSSARSTSVWIAQPTPDLIDKWEILASAIRQLDAGVDVRPLLHSTYPLADGTAFRAAVEADIRESNILIQLLGEAPGPRLWQGQGTINSVQNTLARLHTETAPDVTFLKWRETSIALDAVADPLQCELLKGSIASGFEPFRQQVLDAIRRRLQPPPAIAPSQTMGALSLCVTAGPRDNDLSEQVADVISGIGHVPFIVPSEPESGQSPADYRQLVEGLFADMHGVILVHGKETGIWVQSRHSQIRKVLAPSRKGVWGAFLNGPPMDKKPLRISDPAIMPLDCSNGVQAAVIRDFVRVLETAAGG